MSDEIVDDARPSLSYSTPSFHREAVELQHRFATLAGGGHMTQQRLVRMMQTVPGYLYWSEDRLSDGYIPLAVVHLKTRRGKIAVVFPKCNDEEERDGTRTDRSVTIHFMGEVTPADAIVAKGNVLRAMPMPLKPREESPADPDWEPCGFAGRAGAT